MLVQVFPSSRVTCTVPSSVPAYSTPGCFGDSASVMMAGHCEMPSFRAMVMSFPATPMVTMVSRTALVVRSGEIASHESPRSRLRKTRLAATSSTPGSCAERMSGVSQWKRNASPRAALVTFCAVGRMDRDSPVTTLRRIRLPSCDSVYTMRLSRRSGSATKPSPPRIWNQSWLKIPRLIREALGPHQL